MYPMMAATFALVIGFRLLQLILPDDGSELKFTYGKLKISVDAAPAAPEAWLQGYYEKFARSRITYLELKSINFGILYNVLAPEVFCPYTVRVGSLADGGKFVCNPAKAPKNCSIYSLGINNEISFDEDIQGFNNFTCRIFGYEKRSIDSSIATRYTKINGKVQQLEIASNTDPKRNRYTLGALVEHNNDTSVELLKMDLDGGERYFLIPFLERYKVCQVMVEVHGRPPVHVSLLSRIAKLNYALFSLDVHPRVPSACEYSFIHLDCMQAYGAYMLKRYLNNVKVPHCSQQKHFSLIPFQC
ncbi:hypothetical protein GCK32_005065 [Trichostrongylus colubriformis]|uniref:Methyltransferase domain-containing protein n=1 Tax=Trichostrongylus colubriformis TaxID=6319 RepID=A0AAN8FRL0_TRICO